MSDPEKMRDSGTRRDSKTADFILQLYLIIIGIAFGFSIQNFISDEITIASIARFLTVVIILTIWLHGQVGYGLSETYDVGHNWFGRVLENYVEIADVVLIMATALLQNKGISFFILVLASYGFDLLLEFAYVLRLRATGNEYQREREVARSWLYVDIIAVIIMSLILILGQLWQRNNDIVASIGFLVVVFALSLWDYSYNRDFYFGLSRPKTSKASKETE